MTHTDEIRTVEEGEPAPGSESTATTVTVHEPSPGRTVFTENGNADGWIATDVTVELSR